MSRNSEEDPLIKLKTHLEVFLGSIIVLALFGCALGYCANESYESGLADGKFIENCAHHDGGEAHRTGKDSKGNETGPLVCQHITPAVIVTIPLDGG